MPTPATSHLPIAIIGGGITGLSAAYHLAKQGRSFKLFEASGRLGGNVRSEQHEGWLIEAGPNSIQQTPAIGALLTELGLSPLVASPEAKNRYLVRNSRLVAAPSSPPALLTSRLFSISGKLRIFGDLFQRPQKRPADLSLARFAAEHFGQEAVDYGLSAFIAGVYAGDINALSARHSFPQLWATEAKHGSLIRGMIAQAKAKRKNGERSGPPPIISFLDGLEILPRALASRLPTGSVELNTRVTRLTYSEVAQTWQLHTEDTSPHPQSFSSVILALPAAALAQLVISDDQASLAENRPLSVLAEIPYPPVSSWFLGYKREQVEHPLDGFGVLIPPIEKKTPLGVLFNSTLFPQRAPDGHVAITVMTGGALSPELARLNDDALLSFISKDLALILGVTGDPVFSRRTVWPRAIPQYNLGYEQFLDTITQVEAAHPRLLIGGHVRDGISLPNCLAAGEKLATRALN